MREIAIGCALLQGHAVPARADDARERAARGYEDARKAFNGGAFQAAAVGFERVFHEVSNGASMLAAGRAWEKASEPALAADDFRIALSTGDLTANESTDAKERLDRLEAGLGRVRLLGPDGTTVRLAHSEAVHTPAIAHARPGAMTVIATLPDGKELTRSVVVELGGVATVDFRPEEAPRQAAIAVRAPPQESEARLPPRGNAARTAGWITGGGALAAGITAAILAPLFNAKNNDWNASSKTDGGQRDTVVSLQIGTDIAFLSACALAATSVTLLVFSTTSVAVGEYPPHPRGAATTPPSASYAPRLMLGVGSAALEGQFE